ncbi:RPC3 polymerase, partial [Lophotis ruficrista]|nr:RPC3 polymerase [Lophotis ruficrista]
MTQAEIKLCSLLLREHFGEIVEKIGTHLLRTGAQPLRLLVGDTGLLLEQAKKALCVLIQHNLASYRLQKRGFVEYEAHCERVLRLLRYPRYIYTAKTLYGDGGELLVEELLLNGKMTMSAVVRKVADRLTETMEGGKLFSLKIKKKNREFGSGRGLAGERRGAGGARRPGISGSQRRRSAGAGKRRRSCDEEESGERQAKRRKEDGESSEVPAPAPPRGCQSGAGRGLSPNVTHAGRASTGSEIVRTMLRMSEVTTSSGAPYTQPLSSNEIFRSLPAGYNIGKQVLDQYLTLLADDPLEFVGKSGDSGGGTYTVSILCQAPASRRGDRSRAEPPFGSRCARIFRLLLRKKHLEQKQVEDFAMIPAKEAKEMLYKMLSENFVALQEIPKTPDHAPSRTFYLYAVNVPSCARMLLHRCYK